MVTREQETRMNFVTLAQSRLTRMLGLNIIAFAKTRDFIYKAGRRGEGTKAGLQNGPIRGVNTVSSTSSQGYLA